MVSVELAALGKQLRKDRKDESIGQSHPSKLHSVGSKSDRDLQ